MKLACNPATLAEIGQAAGVLDHVGGVREPVLARHLGPHDAPTSSSGRPLRAVTRCTCISRKILHPMIPRRKRPAGRAPPPLCRHMNPILVEPARVGPALRRVVVVDCPEEMQVQRVTARNGLRRMKCGAS